MTQIQQTIAKNIRFYRNQKGMTQEQLAEKAGTATNFIGCIEIGNKAHSFKMIEKIANALEIDQFALFKNPTKTFGKIDFYNFENTLIHNIINTIKSTFDNTR